MRTLLAATVSLAVSGLTGSAAILRRYRFMSRLEPWVFYEFQQFMVPVVYTPGNNEWTDCHKSSKSVSNVG